MGYYPPFIPVYAIMRVFPKVETPWRWALKQLPFLDVKYLLTLLMNWSYFDGRMSHYFLETFQKKNRILIVRGSFSCHLTI
jgi:hypothetical protein